jgi:hypothetical protein
MREWRKSAALKAATGNRNQAGGHAYLPKHSHAMNKNDAPMASLTPPMRA